jgi:2,3-bisphosphoglycerate-independent phosphoglycerate mutase
MDGYGLNPDKRDNAIALAKTPNLSKLFSEFPFTSLKCSGEAVGLPEGIMGNSEVGHLNIGAGRVVYQDLVRISKSITDGDFFKNKVLLSAIKNAKKNNSALHLMGLLSDGCVHSDITHLFALLELAKREGLKEVYIHALLDGRDTPPRSALKYFDLLEEKIKTIGVGKIATVMGRYYAMDRDKRWDRVNKAYNAIVIGEGEEAGSGKEAVQKAYARGENDEFVLPTVIKSEMGENDSFIFFNFRSDRAREITRALIDPKFDGFVRKKTAKLYFVCMCQYDVTIKAPVAYSQQELKHILSQVLSEHGLKQLRIAETEKYAHVTFFFNGGVEKPYPLEDRILIPSPKVATYDLKPEMSAFEVTDRVLQELDRDHYDVVIMNYANCDMVGHTGIMAAAVAAVETVDACVGRVAGKVLEKGGIAMVTADHGNAEKMVDEETHQAHTAHTTLPVPFCLIGERYRKAALKDGGKLADIAPTMIELLKIKKPKEMTGTSLIPHN